MTSFPLPPRRKAAIAPMILAGVSCWSGVSFAQSAATPTATSAPAAQPATSSGDTIRLSDEERDSIMDTNTVESAAAARGEVTGSDRAAATVHGEVGAAIGSNGMRAVYGTAAIPLGGHAAAVVSFESSRFGQRR